MSDNNEEVTIVEEHDEEKEQSKAYMHRQLRLDVLQLAFEITANAAQAVGAQAKIKDVVEGAYELLDFIEEGLEDES